MDTTTTAPAASFTTTAVTVGRGRAIHTGVSMNGGRPAWTACGAEGRTMGAGSLLVSSDAVTCKRCLANVNAV